MPFAWGEVNPKAIGKNTELILVVFYSFEKTLKQKLAAKSSGATNEETVLLKAFKYFDLNNNGTVEPDEFAKAVEKIGIMIPTRQVSSYQAADKPCPHAASRTCVLSVPGRGSSAQSPD